MIVSVPKIGESGSPSTQSAVERKVGGNRIKGQLRPGGQSPSCDAAGGIPDEITDSVGGPFTVFFKKFASDGLLRPLYLLIRRLVWTYRLRREWDYDFGRYYKYSSAVRYGNSREKLQALLTMAYHSLEKGMSLKNPRPGFGRHHVIVLISRLERYLKHCGVDSCCMVAANVLKSYDQFNRSVGFDLGDLHGKIACLHEAVGKASSGISTGGTKAVKREDLFKAARFDMEPFFANRFSVRQYSEEKVARSDIERAVRMAQKTPSVCNRQSAKVWYFDNPTDVQDALKIQGGADGFRESVPGVLVVTSDLAAFQSEGERYQCWIDGGLFAMSLIYALHSLGLVTCCLNWSKVKRTDLKFKERFKISGSESIIMLISVGHPLPEFRVAESWRKPLDQVLIIPDSSK